MDYSLSEEEYKKLQKEFVSNLNGTSLSEVTLLSLHIPLCCLLHLCLMVLISTSVSQRYMGKGWQFILDVFIIIVPGFIMLTVLPEHVNIVVTSIFATCLFLFLYTCKDPWSGSAKKVWHTYMGGKPVCISHFKATVLMATIICILAVDFQAFPRRLAKVELYGASLMDCGVGGFIVSHGLTTNSITPAKGHSNQSSSLWSSLLRKCMPLLLLGLVRLLGVKGTNYHEHVTEYGVHWNFFFSLATVKVLGTLILSTLPAFMARHLGILGFLVGISYQLCLSFFGLSNFLTYGYGGENDRQDLFEANREGLFSSVGYLSLFLIAVHIGVFVKERRTYGDVLKTLIIFDVVCWASLHLCVHHVDHISRRFVNLPYIMWQVGLQTLVLISFILVDASNEYLKIKLTWKMPQDAVVMKGAYVDDSTQAVGHDVRKMTQTDAVCVLSYPSQLIAAVNRNALFLFLFCNLITGSVNFSLRTILVGKPLALTIIATYLVLSYLMAHVLHWNNLTIGL